MIFGPNVPISFIRSLGNSRPDSFAQRTFFEGPQFFPPLFVSVFSISRFPSGAIHCCANSSARLTVLMPFSGRR